MARRKRGGKIQGLALLCVLGFCCGLGQRCGKEGSDSSERTNSRRTLKWTPYYSTCQTGRSSNVLAEIAAAAKRFPTTLTDTLESCEQITSTFRAGDKVRDQEKENLFDTRYKFKRVRWRGKVVEVTTTSWTLGETHERFGTQHGVVLQFQCNPASVTNERVSSDGVVFFDGDKIDGTTLKRLERDSIVEFEAVLTDYSTRLNIGGGETCLYLKGLSFR